MLHDVDEVPSSFGVPVNGLSVDAPVQLDAIDRRILAVLRDEGRRPNTEIARAVGVSEPTVRKRLDRMLQQGVLKIMAVLNAAATGYPVDAIIGIKVQSGRLRDVGRQLAAIEQVTYVGYVNGRYDLLVEVLLRDGAELFEFLSVTLQQVDGIASSETFNVMHTEKFSYMWLPSDTADAGDDEAAGAPRRAAVRAGAPSESPSVWQRTGRRTE
jgi:Lrp/AsnC family transcriptional regulator, regulator for asnA, asnC and gidA